MTDVIKDANEYLQKKAEINPVLRLQLMHKKKVQEKDDAAEKRMNGIRETQEYNDRTERWAKERDELNRMNINMSYIRKQHQIYLDDIEEIGKKFDAGLLPSQIKQKNEHKPKTDLEIAKENINAAIKKMDFVVAEAKKLLES